MDQHRAAATLTIAFGLALAVVGLALPGALPQGRVLAAAGLASTSHVTALAVGADGSLLAATQAGELWRYRAGRWSAEAGLAGQVITALAGEPGQLPIGTAAGLWWPDGEPLPDRPRVLDILATEQRLVIATGAGVWVHADGHWQRPTPAISAYRLLAQHRGAEPYLHVGTVGDGVYSAPSDRLLEPWQPNGRGLPDGAKVLSLVETAASHVLAGTDQGLFWQAAPGHTWQEIATGLGKRRILALHCAPPGDAGRQRLWIGTDAGLVALDLREDADQVLAPEPALFFAVAPGEPPLESPVSAIVPVGEQLMLSAGAVYELRDARPRGGHLLSLAGIGVAIIGAWIGLRTRIRYRVGPRSKGHEARDRSDEYPREP